MPQKDSAETAVRDIRRKFSAEEKIRIVLERLRGEESIAFLSDALRISVFHSKAAIRFAVGSVHIHLPAHPRVVGTPLRVRTAWP